ncbi:MAG: Tex family protein [Myxococcota bacterium]
MSDTAPAYDPTPQIARDLKLPKAGVARVVSLLADGNTIPFIARYRKEATGGLDEVAIRGVQERREYLEALEDRRRTILESIEEQGKLTKELRGEIRRAETKAELEDLYLPFKPKRRTKATIARERGLEPLARRILAQPRDGNPRKEAARFVDRGRDVPSADGALEGARHIVAEAVAETPGVRAGLRKVFRRDGLLVSKAKKGAKKERTRFEEYYDYREPVRRVPSHRYLAVRRGEREGVLRVSVDVDARDVLPKIEREMGLDRRSPWSREMATAVEDAWKRLLVPSMTHDALAALKLAADRDAVDVFARNLRNLLLAAPLGGRPVVAVDPGLRTGSKCVALDATGRFLDHMVVYPARGKDAEREAAEDLVALVRRHGPDAVAIGNGTGGREMERLARRALKDAGLSEVVVVQVNEAGASVYSASDIAREEFPDLDLTVRGAISIGRRLQDPLAELVKIDPKSIGVGQYQHDVDQGLLQRKLDEVVESCVNQVGVDLNTASAPLLARVAGIGPKTAQNVVARREERGPFRGRRDLLDVAGLGPKTFEQCAGFLRVRGSSNPLDASAVHPERYGLVKRIARDLGASLDDLVGDPALVDRIDPRRYVDDEVGEPTLRDILAELRKPGLDPREDFEPPRFREDVESLEDLEVGMVLEGVVTNVTAFGAFVDVGVHQDGLVHVSKLARRFVKNPADVVAAGDRITVKVLDVDLQRRRISLDARGDG